LIKGVTSDGHSGLEKALSELFPNIPHQRCLVHLQRDCQGLLTRKPETQAGKELLEIVKQVNQIKSHYEKNIWITWFERFEKRNQEMLKQRSQGINPKTGKQTWWYTHRNLRKAYRAIKTSMPKLFLYLDCSNLTKDTNGLEGEFSHLKRKLSLHRGLKRKRKVNLVRWYFYLKSQAENI